MQKERFESDNKRCRNRPWTCVRELRPTDNLEGCVLVLDEKVEYDICDNCSKCIDSCPVNALNDISAFGRKSCSTFYKIVNKKLEIQCYKCRTACPHCLGILSNE